MAMGFEPEKNRILPKRIKFVILRQQTIDFDLALIFNNKKYKLIWTLNFLTVYSRFVLRLSGI